MTQVTTMECRGLDPPFKGRRHAPNCPKRATVPIWSARGRKLFYETEGTYLSKSCLMWDLALRDLKVCLDVVRAHGPARYPHSWPELYALRHRANVIRRAERGSNVRFRRPDVPRGVDRALHGPRRLAHGWSLSAYLVGVCAGCGTLTFARHADGLAATHARCRVRGTKHARRHPEVQRNFDWAVRHHLGGELLADLAGDYAKDNVVANGIRSVLDRLPPSELVTKPLRKYVEALAEATGCELPTWDRCQPCGTRAAYQRHLRRSEPPCDACAGMARAYLRAYKASVVHVGECGHRVSYGARSCMDCFRAERAALPIKHGTHAGYQAHWRRREPACEACLRANREISRLAAQRSRARKRAEG